MSTVSQMECESQTFRGRSTFDLNDDSMLMSSGEIKLNTSLPIMSYCIYIIKMTNVTTNFPCSPPLLLPQKVKRGKLGRQRGSSLLKKLTPFSSTSIDE